MESEARRAGGEPARVRVHGAKARKDVPNGGDECNLNGVGGEEDGWAVSAILIGSEARRMGGALTQVRDLGVQGVERTQVRAASACLSIFVEEKKTRKKEKERNKGILINFLLIRSKFVKLKKRFNFTKAQNI